MQGIRSVLGMGLGLLLACTAGAAQEVGNGGDSIVCDSSTTNRKFVELYDYYEARERFGRTLDLGGSELSVAEKVELLISRIETHDSIRAREFRVWHADFFRETAFVSGVDLIDIPDTGNGFIPHGCQIRQLAIQVEPSFPGERRYTIDQELWDRLDNDDKAGLIFHELALRDSIRSPNSQTNSIGARYFHGAVAARETLGIALRAYHDLLRLSRYARGTAHGLPVALKNTPQLTMVYHDENTVANAVIYDGEKYEYAVEGQPYRFVAMGLGGGSEIGEIVDFYLNGQPKRLGTLDYDVAQPLNIVREAPEMRFAVSGRIRWGSLGMAPSGRISSYSGHLENGGEIRVDMPNLVCLNSGSILSFDLGEDGERLRALEIRTFEEIAPCRAFFQGRWQNANRVTLDANGNILSAQ